MENLTSVGEKASQIPIISDLLQDGKGKLRNCFAWAVESTNKNTTLLQIFLFWTSVTKWLKKI